MGKRGSFGVHSVVVQRSFMANQRLCKLAIILFIWWINSIFHRSTNVPSLWREGASRSRTPALTYAYFLHWGVLSWTHARLHSKHQPHNKALGNGTNRFTGSTGWFSDCAENGGPELGISRERIMMEVWIWNALKIPGTPSDKERMNTLKIYLGAFN